MSNEHERIPTKISPDILDTIGRSFKFSHGKGISEWLKNSLDHYLRLYEAGKESLQGNWPVLINVINADKASNGPNFAVVDFGGTTYINVKDFFLHWGDTKAASLGGKTAANVTGGHGNGGKFYMREMWKRGTRFLTWRDGLVTSLIVDKHKPGTTGEWEKKNESMHWRDALKIALPEKEHLGGVDWLIAFLEDKHHQLLEELDNQERGFTVVVGLGAKQIHTSNDIVTGGSWKHQKLIDDIRDAPQARRPLRELSISVYLNGQLSVQRLEAVNINEDPDWPANSWNLERTLIVDNELLEGASEIIGSLKLRKAADQLTGIRKHLNALSVIDGNNNPIASYPIRELPLPGNSTLISFLFGELQLTFQKITQLTENDRERLVDSPTSQSILTWVAERIWERIKEFEKEQRETEHRSELELAAILNEALNNHAHRFLQELETEILVDFIEDPAGGGPGNTGSGTGPKGGSSGGDRTGRDGRGGSTGETGTIDKPGTSHPQRKPRFPEVLLSGYHPDPSSENGAMKSLTERHPPLYQEDIDKKYNVWWINTEHPFAKEALNRGGAEGPSFRNHHLFMFTQVVQFEWLRILERREAELGLDVVENELIDMANRSLAELPRDLADRLLE